MISQNEEAATALKRVYTVLSALSSIEIVVIALQLLLMLEIAIFGVFPLFLHDCFNAIYVSLFAYSFFIYKRVENGDYLVKASKWLFFFILYLVLNFIYLFVVLLYYHFILGGPSLAFSTGQEELIYPTAIVTIVTVALIAIKTLTYFLLVRALSASGQFLQGQVSGIRLVTPFRRTSWIYILASAVNILALSFYYWAIDLELGWVNSGHDLSFGPREYLLAPGLPHLFITFLVLVPLVVILVVYQTVSYWKIRARISNPRNL
ncbi:MAG: hypothetical protein ACFFD4_05265 [Candidatus Odinarchaeota archaeon]